MASIIKNQILKHLSKFAKNLSANSISVSTLRGEGELTNLELNEKVLTELLELPNWMQISQATVNKVAIKIPWTKLKNTPIVLTLDEVFVEMETVSELRPNTCSSELSAYKSNSKYGFVEKVIDGLTVLVNSVQVKFRSPNFMTSLHLTKISLCSKSPSWQHVDLRMTRLKDLNQQYVLIFKELFWHSLRIEAKSNDPYMTPIRLITNQSCCRITIKKKLSDCSVIGCRLVLLSEDLLWVLTDSQILAAHLLAESLSGLIKKSTEQSQKEKAARKLASINKYSDSYMTGLNNSTSQGKTRQEKGGLFGSDLTTPPTVDQSSLHRYEVFRKFDVAETSYHFSSERVDLHFCDDTGSGRSSYPDLDKGGTLQMGLMKVRMDFYPYHPAYGERTHWIRYQSGSLHQWTKTSLNNFKNVLYEFFGSKKSSHTPLGRASPHLSQKAPPTPTTTTTTADSGGPEKTYINDRLSRLMSVCLLLSCKDAIVYKVASAKRKSKITEMLTSYSEKGHSNDGSPLMQLEFSSYYFPAGVHYPVPPPKIFTQVNPVKLEVDFMSCLWLNAFACNLIQQTLKTTPDPPYLDIQLECIMPKMILKPIIKSEKQKDRPRSLQACASRFAVSNVRSFDPTRPGSKSALFTCLEEAQKGPLFFASSFPSKSGDRQAIPSKFLRHAEGSDLVSRTPNSNSIEGGYPPEALWLEPRDMLFLYSDNVWVDYVEKKDDQSTRINPVFVEPFSVSVWVYIRELSLPSSSSSSLQNQQVSSSLGKSSSGHSYQFSSRESNNKQNSFDMSCEASWHILAYIPSIVKVYITHLQYLFLMRILDSVAEFTTFLNEDSSVIQSKLESTLVAAILPDIHVSLIVPAVLPQENEPMSPTALFNGNPLNTSALLSPIRSGFDDNLSAQTATDTQDSILCSQSIPYVPLIECDSSLAKSQSDSCITAGNEPGPSKLDFPDSSTMSKSGEDLLSTTPSNQSPKVSSLSGSKVLSRKNSNSSVSSSVKKGITSGLQSLKITIESVGSKHSNDDASETASICSDISNESDNFVMLNLNSSSDNLSSIDCSFFKTDSNQDDHYDEVEAAMEALEDTTPSFSEPSETSASTRTVKYVGVISLKIGNCQLVLEGEGHNSILKFQSMFLSLKEYGRVCLEDYQAKNIKPSLVPISEPMSPSSIKLRLTTEGVLKVTSSGVSDFDLPYYLQGRYSCSLPLSMSSNLDIEVSDVTQSLTVSSLMLLTEMVQDEIDLIPLPMQIKLENISFEMIDEKSKLKKNSQRFLIPKLYVTRNETGNFTIQPSSVKDFEPPLTATLYTSNSLNLPSLPIGPEGSTGSSLGHDKCTSKERELTNELDKVREQLASCQRENANLMKALRILHEDLN